MTETPSKKTPPACVAFHLPTMDCPSCVQHVEDALKTLPDVGEVSVSLLERTVSIRGEALDAEALAGVLTNAGYRPVEQPEDAPPEAAVSLWRTPQGWRTGAAGLLWLAAVALSFWPNAPVLGEVWRWQFTVGALAAIAGAALGGINFLPSAARSARALSLTIDVLMSIAVIGALILGDFNEAAAIGFLFSLAELIEARSMSRAREALRGLIELAPPVAFVRRESDVVPVPVAEVLVGEVVSLRPGDRIPLDGVVTKGTSDVNESALTGEPVPAKKTVGDEVFAGTLTVDGYLEMKVVRAAPDTVLAHVVELVRTAHEKKARIEQFVQRFARFYTPAVVGSAALIAILPPVLFAGDWSVWVLRGLTLLVISCPCALVISTPVSIVSAITSGAKNGIVVTGGEYLEVLGHVRAIAFDKTGTITKGMPQVRLVVSQDGTPEDDVLRRAALLEARSSHPLARGVVEEANARGISLGDGDVADVEIIPGRGIRGLIGRERHRVVTAETALPERIEAERNVGHVVLQVERNDAVEGYIVLADTLRPEAREIVAALRELGIEEIVMLTGDHERAARAVAASVGIESIRASCLPADKLDAIEALKKRYGSVAMVGDGINDAPALAAATVGIAMGAAGSPTALDAADIALMGDDLHLLPYLVRLSRTTRSVIRENIWAAILIKALMIVGVPLGIVTMTLAVLVGDMGTSLAVTSNAVRLAKMKA